MANVIIHTPQFVVEGEEPLPPGTYQSKLHSVTSAEDGFHLVYVVKRSDTDEEDGEEG